eukprot:400526_1
MSRSSILCGVGANSFLLMNLIHDTFLFALLHSTASGCSIRSGIKWYMRRSRSCAWFEGRISISVCACSISVRSEETLVGWIWSLHPQSLSFLFLDICLNIHRMPIEWFVCT